MMQSWKTDGKEEVAAVEAEVAASEPPAVDRKPRTEEAVHNEFIRLVTSADPEFDRITREIGLSKREEQLAAEFCERDEAMAQRATKRHAVPSPDDGNVPNHAPEPVS
jgi:carbamate kinase